MNKTKKIYITTIPLDSNFVIEPKCFDYSGPEFCIEETKGCFPIVKIMQQTLEEHESAKLIVVRQKNTDESKNLEILKGELSAVGFGENVDLVVISAEENQKRGELLTLFQNAICHIEDNAVYYADVTFGTKTFPLIIFSILRYAANIYTHTDVKGIYYLEVKRSAGKPSGNAKLYNIAYLYSLDNIIFQLGQENPELGRQALNILFGQKEE